MLRWPRIPDRGTVALAAALCVAAAMPLAAQQAETATSQAAASATPPGPRLRPEWRSVEPGVADSSAAGSVTAVAAPNTVTITTLTLVLVAIIVILLVT